MFEFGSGLMILIIFPVIL